MYILKDLQPKNVFRYFEDICSIPHGSGNTKAISDYCVTFAAKHGLKYIQDDFNNVIIFKNGSPGYENSAPVIIQGHLDMVCEKEAGCNIDFERDGLTLKLQGDYITAKGTTLGGDDGIAVAYALAILDDDSISHPPLEVVLTVDEEIGMLGAAALDYSPLKGRIMLNLDSEDEGILLVSCAGGVTATCHLPVTRGRIFAAPYGLSVTGLQGGHSGVEIDKGRANASKVLGRILYELSRHTAIRLISIEGGLKDNAIPREAHAQFIILPEEADRQQTFNTETPSEETSQQQSFDIATSTGDTTRQHSFDIEAFVREWQHILRDEYASTDPDITLELAAASPFTQTVLTRESTEKAITALYLLPNGIQSMSHDIEGLVQTSQNLGIMKTVENEVIYSFSTRSSVASEKLELLSRMECLMSSLGGYITTAGDYPAWQYKKDSPLRELMVEIFEVQYGYKPEIQALHAGVECGLFAGALSGLDCVSFGPVMHDIHTPKEELSVSSVERTWKYTLEILKRLK